MLVVYCKKYIYPRVNASPLLSCSILPVCVPEYPSLWIASNDKLANFVIDKDEHGIWHTNEHVQDIQWSCRPDNSQKWYIGDQAHE